MQPTRESEAKKRVGYRAADLVKEGMVLGLGTGSTVQFVLERLGQRIQDGLTIRGGVPTSHQTALRSRLYGIPLLTLDEVKEIDLTIDGADQIDSSGYLVKGRGAALVREKCVADASRELVIVITPEKQVDRLSVPVPVEVIPFGWSHVVRRVAGLQGRAVLREGERKDGPVITDNGNMVLDCDFGPIPDPPALEDTLDRIPGIVGNGLFTRYRKKTVVLAGEEKESRYP